jgi:hypothetical protein
MIHKEEKGIVVAGSGWILAGVSSLSLYLYLGGRAICNCPNIPSGLSAKAATAICHCPSPPIGLLAIGILALLSGIWIILARRMIARMRARLMAKSRRYKSK